MSSPRFAPPRGDHVRIVRRVVTEPGMNPWLLEIITVSGGSHPGTGRRTLSRDVERGLLVRLRQGAYVERAGFEGMSPEDQHLVRTRAFAAVAPQPPVFGFWSAALVQRLPVLRSRLSTVHTVVDERRGRGQLGVTAHLFPLADTETATSATWC